MSYYNRYDGDEGFYNYGMANRRAYYPYGPFRIVTVIMLFAAVVVLLFSLTCALLYVADFAEEYPSLVRKVIKWIILFNVVAHASILVVEHISWWRSCLSLGLNMLYWRIMHAFPFVPQLTHPIIATTIIGVFVESAAWYWACVPMVYYTSAIALFGFFMMLWTVPIALVATCIPESERLPGAGMYDATTSNSALPSGGRKQRTILSRIVEFIRPPDS